jgi:hypothetical protein
MRKGLFSQMSEPRTSENRLAAHDRKLRALELRKHAMTYPEIARELGYAGPSGAYQAVIGALRETLREPAEQVRTLELERLDAMLEAVWPAAVAGDLKTIDAVLRLMDRRSRYLGLDAPARIDIEQRIRAVAEELGLDPDRAVAEAAEILRTAKGRL